MAIIIAMGGVGVQSIQAREAQMVDRVLVKKSDRKLYLLKEGKILKTFPVDLGENPNGHKTREGDSRTPEGTYMLDWRNPNSRFFRSIHISYPNEEDKRRAEELGVSPGGNIMLHGLPNVIGRLIYLTKGKDWTKGCIAVDNEAMSEIWEVVADNTPIDILP